MSSNRPASTSCLVTARSSADGVGSPDGWLWQRVTDAARDTIAAQNPSPGCPSDELRIPRVIASGAPPISRCCTSSASSQNTSTGSPLLLRDPQLGLRGRPDYLLEFEVAGHPLYVPLELKPGRRSRRIYESDALQVAAYLIALRATAKDDAATFGYLRYATGTFKVGLSSELERRVSAIVQAIRAGRSAATVNRSHSIVQRCVNCSVREHCNQALG